MGRSVPARNPTTTTRRFYPEIQQRERGKACKGRRLGGEENTKTYVSQTNGMERSKKQTRERKKI